MRYPIQRPSSIPGSGNALYLHLLENVSIPARATHAIWFNGCQKLLEDPENPFQGYYPVGKTLRLSYGGKEEADYTFTGEEKNPVFVKDLSPEARIRLGVSSSANEKAKVFNPYFLPYDKLPEKARKDNELPALSLAKSICSFLSSQDALFTEIDCSRLLTVAIRNCSSAEMRHILHGNHVAWCASRFLNSGEMETDIKRNFYGQNDMEFYIKDVGTIMPAMLYTLAILGASPVEIIKDLDYDLWGIEDTAEKMATYMAENQASKAA